MTRQQVQFLLLTALLLIGGSIVMHKVKDNPTGMYFLGAAMGIACMLLASKLQQVFP